MATAPPRPSPRPESPAARPAGAPRTASRSGVLGAFDAVYRFLASVKLAVICLGALAATLSYGTWFNSRYGQNAVNEYVFQSTGFALLMAFLAINIFCAAAIRFPWAKRQTGFVITHVGLLTVIGGSWYAAQTADEGLLGMKEGETSDQLIRNHVPTLYVKPVDPHTGKSQGEYKIFVHPGAFDWEPGRYQVVSKPSDPFKLAIKGFYPCSVPDEVVVPDPAGGPMVKLRPQVIPPGATSPVDVFGPRQDPWFSPGDDRLGRMVKTVRPAQFVVSRAPRAEVLDDFLDPPADPGIEGVARLHYEDRAGVTRRFDVRIDEARVDQFVSLPDSDLRVAYKALSRTPIPEAQQRTLGTDTLDIVKFAVRRGDAEAVDHNGFAMLPSIPAIIPGEGRPPSDGLLRINYYSPPIVDPKVNGMFGVVEVMVDRAGRMAYRVFERGNPGKLRAHGPLKVGETITAFGGTGAAPMTLKFDVEQFLKGGRREASARSIALEPRERDTAIPAVLAELTVNGKSRDIWLRKSADEFDIAYKTVAFDDSLYDVAFDVDRLKLGFSLTLDDFDVGFDPGTSNASSYKSEVRLTDEKAGIKDQARTISMNNVLDHAGWRFFQTTYTKARDKETDLPTGEFISVFQVAKNPARNIIYAGCIVVVLGAFVQFYMRAGLFSDGGKLQQQRAALQAKRRLEAKRAAADPAPAPQAKQPNRPKSADDFEPL